MKTFLLFFFYTVPFFLTPQTVSFKLKNPSLKEVIEQIETQTNLKVAYNEEIKLEDTLKGKFDYKSLSLMATLKNLTERSVYRFKKVGNNIAVNKKLFSQETSSNTPDFQFTITGSVKDASGIPIPSVTVQEKNTNNGVLTDFDGNYTIEADSTATLVFSFIGYQTAEVPISGRTGINVTLEEDVSGLDEVVVVGYGTQKKKDLTGAVSSVKVEEVQSATNTSVDGLLKGVSGINVVQNNGEPGAGFSINIRGASSVSAGNSPLYVIDGFPIDNTPALLSGGDPGFSGSRTPKNPLASINPQDIESIEILKDASAAAIYGSRGANGVILITTKSGTAGKVKINFQTSFGFQTPFNQIDLLSPQDYKRVLNQIIEDGGGSQDEIIGELANNGNGTYWQDEVTESGALMQNHQLSFTGGNEKSKYFLSMNVTDQNGVVKKTDFSRIGLRFNLDSQVTDKFKIGLNATTAYTENSYVPNGFDTNENAGALYAAVNFDPTLGIKDEDGNYIISPFLSIDNPLALIYGTSSNAKSNRILATLTGEYAFTDAFSAKLNLGGDILNEKRKNYISRLTKNGRNNGGIAGNYQGDRTSYLTEFTLNYNQNWKNHALTALAGATYQRFFSSKLTARANNFPSDATQADNLSLGSQDTYNINNPATGHRLASLIGRVNYIFQGKYSATLTARRDGSSRFGANNKYGTFPSAAIAWNISEENFMNKNETINFLKLRTSWGLTGNQEIGDFAYQTTYEGGNPAVWDGQLVTTTAPARLPNPDLKWEQTEQIDIGLDFGLWKNRVNGGIDYYRKRTTDMLLDLPVPLSTGFNSILTNIGEIKNSGLDFSLRSNNIVNDNFQWTTNITITTLKNEVVSLGDIPEINAGSGFLHVPQVGIIRPGEPLNSFYGWEVSGVWQQEDDFSMTNENVQPGDLKYVDQNNDGYINGDDRVILGNSFPDFQWSLANTFSYKNFDLYFYIDGAEGAQMLNGNIIESYFPINFRRNKFAEPYLNRWTPENPTNEYPSFVNPLSQGRKTVNSKTVQDASYIKLSNVRLSYNIPESITWFPPGQVFISADNVFIITDYDGLDPSINPNNNASLRVDFNSYPTARTMTLGLKLDL